ncbi:peptidase inhibitor family I36 protein [Amycolatopsis dendrobii]|uniref:Peptidase inhibitor family I36 protein n=1 Tax=Amycolatopsis dendrobii TaxID=2760662 RepID=A0A7W3VS01_9PSEU|nr:peptidase inhibitor family I36 protein [Amycolatopsis dendrobii]
MKSRFGTATARPQRGSGAQRLRRISAAVAAAAVGLLALVGPAAAAPQAAPAIIPCPYTNFCIYSNPGYTGTMYKLHDCHDYPVAFSGIGSWSNNQTRGTRAVFSNGDGSKYITYPAPSSYPRFDWTPVADIKPC